ncbi:hypothetical protein H0E84_00620 [Luteimonas sp. SJ-92]|uniref:Uncharacterized protein n=1 Tax=Luteimonas salinisoli TaxID=2752307 RepID=A0A853J820_9GAMM|nr:hypothetical protein [Luteimonas salinisoli]NZA24878.1 hypothetical protein [Luteimonas salinisoli]
MLRTFGAILLGLLAAVAIMMALEYAAMAVIPPPAGLDLQSEEDLARLMASASTGKLLWVLAGWCLASFGGAWTAARLARRHRAVAALAVGVLMVVGVAINVAVLPHPLWTTLAGLALPLPLAWLALRLVERSRPPST